MHGGTFSEERFRNTHENRTALGVCLQVRQDPPFTGKACPEEDTQVSGIIWAMGGRRAKDIAHGYLNQEEFEKGHTLCGRTVIPRLQFPHWDVTREEMQSHTCPHCQERAALLELLMKKNNRD